MEPATDRIQNQHVRHLMLDVPMTPLAAHDVSDVFEPQGTAGNTPVTAFDLMDHHPRDRS
jgi:hypothetical protein